MKRKIITLCTLVAFACSLTGCITVSEEHKGAAKGAGIGAATGAIAGAVIAPGGSKTKGAVIGGLAGALLGGLIGNYTVDKKLTAEQTAAKYNFQPTSGGEVRIESVTVVPTVVTPGGKVDVTATYALLSASPDSPAMVTQTCEIRHNGELVGNPEASVSHTGGTYSSTIPIMLPADAKKGSYTVYTTVKTAYGKDSKETSFTVQ